jgi:Ca2+-binding EF-hand superfamily protein
MSQARSLCLALGAGLLAASCRSSAPAPDEPPPAPRDAAPEAVAAKATSEAGPAEEASALAALPFAAPMDVAGDYGSTAGYLLDRYDADGDRAVSPAEYGRSEATFARLDHDGDGVITQADFARSSGGRGGSGMQERMSGMAAQVMLGRYFQSDDELETLGLDEMLIAASEYDTSGDEVVTVDEFTCAYEARAVDSPSLAVMGSMLADADPWESITAAVDQDGDGAVALAELDAYFQAADSDQDGSLDLAMGQRPRGQQRGQRNAPTDGAAPEGSVAPDFTLRSPDGSETVTLSDFAGVKPVALVFGSYT